MARRPQPRDFRIACRAEGYSATGEYVIPQARSAWAAEIRAAAAFVADMESAGALRVPALEDVETTILPIRM